MESIIYKVLLAFVGGGFLSLLAQILIDKTKLTPARILVFFVSLGVLVYGIGLYDPLYEIFGRGVATPLLGFGANIAKGVKEAVDKEGILGALSGGLTASSAGITLALFLGLIFSFIFKTKQKRM
ncbi:MAG: SpoVA/SpoVAEb family sporulation membrane protein [Clostridia bacterium]|nr:SpoVA/SpoVAEb family sporulation membrane protein [Clostridia bacterium]